MDINVYDNYNFYDKREENLEYLHFYTRKVENFTYNKKDMRDAIIKHLKSRNLSSSAFPWGETKNSDKSIKFASVLAENYTEEELGNAPMLMNFNYFSKKIVPDSIIFKIWDDFKSQIHNLKSSADKFGAEEYFEITLNSFMSNPQVCENRQVIEPLSTFNSENGGFINTYLAKLPEIYKKFEYYRKFPIFIKTSFDTSYDKYVSNPTSCFGEILVNHYYFSNSSWDIVTHDPRIEHNTIGDKNIPTVEELCSYILNNLNSVEDPIIDIFIDRSDAKTWDDDVSNYDDKMYYIDTIQFNEKKEDYYQDCIDSLYIWKKVYDIIINFDIDTKQASTQEFDVLLNKIVMDTQEFLKD